MRLLASQLQFAFEKSLTTGTVLCPDSGTISREQFRKHFRRRREIAAVLQFPRRLFMYNFHEVPASLLLLYDCSEAGTNFIGNEV